MKRCTIVVLIFQFMFSHIAFAQQPMQTPAPYKPYLIIDGILLPDEEIIHLPAYRTYIARGFADQPNIQMVDYSSIAQWKKKFTVIEQKPHESYLVHARESLSAGKNHYQELNFQNAMEELTAARNEFILNLSHLRSNRDLLESHLYLGMTYIAISHKSEPDRYKKLAATEFEKVVMLDPQRELAQSNYSPEVIQLYEKVKQRLTANNRITLKIDANVTQAKIYINGKLLGPAPIKARLIAGSYYILAEKQGMKPWSQLVNLQGTVEHVTADLESSGENADWNSMFQIREGTDQQTSNMEDLNDLAKAVGGEIIFLANLDQADNQLRILGQLYDVRTHEFSQVAIVDVGDASKDHTNPIPDFEPAAYDMAKALSGMIRSDGYLINSGQTLLGADPSRLVESKPQTIERHDAPKAKLYERWWFWAGVAVLGAGAYFGIRELGGTGGSTIVIDNQGNF